MQIDSPEQLAPVQLGSLRPSTGELLEPDCRHFATSNRSSNAELTTPRNRTLPLHGHDGNLGVVLRDQVRIVIDVD